ncbi:MAG TPA: ABC transporter substrate-binding protein, partial [Pseudorhizobium sp.]|nr:ABC transporter substrate-binding protein [Pseudorhizobium sp.]
MSLSWLTRSAIITLATSLLTLPGLADEQPQWRHGIAVIGEPELPADFKHLPYVDTDAPKGGELRLASEGTFDNLNLVIDRGAPAAGLGNIYDTLLKRSEDEVFGSYGLLAEAVSYPADMSSATFRLRPEAKWADGVPVTVEDVIFSMEQLKEHSAFYSGYYRHVSGVEKTG